MIMMLALGPDSGRTVAADAHDARLGRPTLEGQSQLTLMMLLMLMMRCGCPTPEERYVPKVNPWARLNTWDNRSIKGANDQGMKRSQSVTGREPLTFTFPSRMLKYYCILTR